MSVGLMLQRMRWLFAYTLQPVVHAAHDDLRGVDVGDGAVFEDHVHLAVVLHVVVVGAQPAQVAETGRARQAVHAGADRARAHRGAVGGLALHALQKSAAVSGWHPLPTSEPPPVLAQMP